MEEKKEKNEKIVENREVDAVCSKNCANTGNCTTSYSINKSMLYTLCNCIIKHFTLKCHCHQHRYTVMLLPQYPVFFNTARALLQMRFYSNHMANKKMD